MLREVEGFLGLAPPLWAPTRKPGEPQNDSVSNQRPPAGGSVWFTGNIESLDADKLELRVKPRPPEPERMIGYRFWKESRGKATPFGQAQNNLADVEDYLAKWNKTPLLTLKMNKQANIILNGAEANFKDLRPGDFAGFPYSRRGMTDSGLACSVVRAARIDKETASSGANQ